MQTLALADGSTIPALGLGTWLSDRDAVRRAVVTALEVGYRHIDAARIYENEREVGQGIAEAIAAGVVSRRDIFVTTKLWNDHHRPEHVRAGLEESLSQLGLDYVDLYLVHWPVAHRHGAVVPRDAGDWISPDALPLAKTWEAMAALPATGLTRHVGVSNFSASKVAEISDAVGVAPAVDQVEMHPYFPQHELVASLRARGVVATAYAPLGSGGRPDRLKRDDERRLLADPTVLEIARATDATPAQVLIAWALARGTAVIPKSTNPERIAANFAAGKLVLNPDDVDALGALQSDERYVDGTFWCRNGSPYTVEWLWR